MQWTENGQNVNNDKSKFFSLRGKYRKNIEMVFIIFFVIFVEVNKSKTLKSTYMNYSLLHLEGGKENPSHVDWNRSLVIFEAVNFFHVC